MASRNLGKYRYRLAGMILLIISVTLIILFSDSIVLPERHPVRRLSMNEQSIPESIHLVRVIILHFILVSLAFGLFFLLDIYHLFQRLFGNYVDLEGLKKFFLNDRLCNKKYLSMFLLISGTFFGTLLQLFFLIIGEPQQEGFMEHISEWILLLSGFVMLISVLKVPSSPYFHHNRKTVILMILGIAAGLFFLFGEEISWGQRVFGFDSFGIFKQYNYQHETNLHNFFNPLFTILYPFVGMSTFVIFCILWFFKKGQSDLIDLFLPPPSLFILTFIMACTAYMGHSEIYEELVYVFALLYSIRILVCLSYPKIDSGIQTQTF
jgi:hypothetical protein